MITSDDRGCEYKNGGEGQLSEEEASEAQQCGFSKDVRILQISFLVGVNVMLNEVIHGSSIKEPTE